MGDESEWVKLPTDEKVQHKVSCCLIFSHGAFTWLSATFEVGGSSATVGGDID